MNKYQKIKEDTEKYWETSELRPDIYGFQFQRNTKWKQGLSEEQIDELEKDLGFKLCVGIREYLAVLNGVDREGINVYGGTREPSYAADIYSYPRDTKNIKDDIERVIADSSLKREELIDETMVFPLVGNKYILNDDSGIILSMHPDDNVYYADSIEDYLREACLGQRHPDVTRQDHENLRIWFKYEEKWNS